MICTKFFLALIAHNVRTETVLEVDIVDEYGMEINEENVSIVKQFKNCSHFFIEVRTKYRHSDINTLVEASF